MTKSLKNTTMNCMANLENLELLDAYKKLHNNTKHKYIRITKNKKQWRKNIYYLHASDIKFTIQKISTINPLHQKN